MEQDPLNVDDPRSLVTMKLSITPVKIARTRAERQGPGYQAAQSDNKPAIRQRFNQEKRLTPVTQGMTAAGSRAN